MIKDLLISVAIIAAVAASATEEVRHQTAKVTIVRLEEPDIVREIRDSSLLRLVTEEKLAERGFRRVTIQRIDGTRFLLEFDSLQKKDFELRDGDKVFLVYEL